MTNNEDLLKLFERISRGEASDKEISEYNRWCQAFQEENLPVSRIEEVTSEMLVDITNRIRHNSQTSRIRLWSKIAVAASVVLALTFGGYYLIHKSQLQQIAQDQTHDLPPGGNKATLTLDNGKTVILDSVHNGKIALQGNSKVSKIDSGLLKYKSGTNHHSELASVSYNTLTVPRGGQYRLILPDGTKVWLNAASSIRYPTAFTKKVRKVAVTGEAYMEVAEDAKKPFIVTTRNTEITVLGTHFNIMAYENEPSVKTTLLEGLIKVSVPGKQTSTIIKPGQQAVVDNSDRELDVKKVNTSNVVAWIHGLLSLKDCSVHEFMNQLSRWYDVDVEYTGKVPQKRFGGMINRNTKLSDMLSALDAAGIYTRLKGKKIIVLSHLFKKK